MPTKSDKGQWDLTDKSGRVSPTIADALAMASGDRSRKRGSFVKYSWRSVLFANDNAADHLGEFDPIAVKRGVGVTQCHELGGGLFTTDPPHFGMYGDYFFFKPQADTFGYLRQYDLGACSASAKLSTFVQTAVDDAAAPRQVPTGDSFPGVGDTVTIRINDIRTVLVPRLSDVPSFSPDAPGTSPFRTPADEGVDVRVDAKGVGTGTWLGSDVSCKFSATYQVGFSLIASPSAMPYYNRVKLEIKDKKPNVNLSGCSGSTATNLLLALTDSITRLLTLGNVTVNLNDLVSGFVSGKQLRGDIMSQFRQLESELNEALVMPVPSVVALRLGVGAPLPQTFFGEWQDHRQVSLPLHAAAAGPASSCLAPDLRQPDNTMCTLASIAPVLARLQELSPRLAAAVTNLIQGNPEMLECRPIRGDATHAKAFWIPPKQTPSGSERTFATFISGCDPSEAARLFAHDGEIFQGCLTQGGGTHCNACFAKQDGGTHCNISQLRAEGCLVTAIDRPPFIGYATPPVPQVSCKLAPGAPPSAVCVPRFHPGPPPGPFTKGSERNAMCVPMQQTAATYFACAPCLDFTSPVTPGALAADPKLKAKVAACLDAPDYCRTPVGTVNPEPTCDATNASDVLLGFPSDVRITTPARCALRLPFSRFEVEPDRLDAVLAEAFPCPNGTSPPCRVANVAAATDAESAAVFWSELVALAGTFGVGLAAPGFDSPGCFPSRDEVVGGLNPEAVDAHLGDPLKPLGSGPMGFLGQGVRAPAWTTVVNSPICGWQNVAKKNAPVAN